MSNLGFYECLTDTETRVRHLARLAVEAGKKPLAAKLSSRADALQKEIARLRPLLHKEWSAGVAALTAGLTRAKAEIDDVLRKAEKDHKVFRRAAQILAAAGRALAWAKKAAL